MSDEEREQREEIDYDEFMDNITNFQNLRTLKNSDLTKDQLKRINYLRFKERNRKAQLDDFLKRNFEKYQGLIPLNYIEEYLKQKKFYDLLIEMRDNIDIELATFLLTEAELDKIIEIDFSGLVL